MLHIDERCEAIGELHGARCNGRQLGLVGGSSCPVGQRLVTDPVRPSQRIVGRRPSVGDRFDAQIIWMADAPLLPGKQYEFKVGARYVFGTVERIHHRTDV
ncbi:MAG: elongation factor 1-alpha C-terminal domain-related protein, partial [Ilumatobacteraceae bacterium]